MHPSSQEATTIFPRPRIRNVFGGGTPCAALLAYALVAFLGLAGPARAQDVAEGGEDQTLEIVRLDLLDRAGGYAIPADSVFFPGETAYLVFNLRGYLIDEDYRIDLEWRIDAVGPTGTPFAQTEGGEFSVEIAPQDESWEPLVRYQAALPQHAPTGEYRILIAVTDKLADTTIRAEVPVRVSGDDVELSDSLAIRNFRYLLTEGGAPLEEPVYRGGHSVFASFFITGYATTEENTYDVSSRLRVIDAKGKQMYAFRPQGEKGSPFYPRLWLPAKFRVDLERNIPPGTYRILLSVHDEVGDQTLEVEKDITVR